MSDNDAPVETTPREMWERDRRRADRAGYLAEWVALRQRMRSAQVALRACPPYGCPKTSAALAEVGAIQREQRKLTREVDRILREKRRVAVMTATLELCEGCAERPVTHVVGCNGKTARVCGECGMRVLACAAAVGDRAGLRRIAPECAV